MLCSEMLCGLYCDVCCVVGCWAVWGSCWVLYIVITVVWCSVHVVVYDMLGVVYWDICYVVWFDVECCVVQGSRCNL